MAHGDAPTIKLILTDIDDTVMPRGMTAVSERTVRAFRAARDAGITVGPSSGRGRAQIAPFFRNDEACFSTAITTNGLEIYAAGEKIAEHRLPTASLEQALSLVSASPRTGMLYFEGSQPYLVVGDREVLGLTMPGYAARCIDADGLPATPVLKANIFLDADFDETAVFAAMLNERVDGLDFDVPLPGYLNIMPSGWNKGSAVLALCEHLGIGTDGIGFAGWLPLLSFVFAILCIAAGMLGMSRRGKATAAVQAVLGAGAFVCAMAFTYVGGSGGLFTGAAAEIADAMIAGGILTVTVSAGNFMAMTGGLLALIGGGLELREMFDLGE